MPIRGVLCGHARDHRYERAGAERIETNAYVKTGQTRARPPVMPVSHRPQPKARPKAKRKSRSR